MNGQKPGDSFANGELAAEDALNWYHLDSVDNDQEYGGYVVSKGPDDYVAVLAKVGGPGEGEVDFSIPGNAVNQWHTHGCQHDRVADPSVGDYNDFSGVPGTKGDDIHNVWKVARGVGWAAPSYLGAPSGAIFRARPSAGEFNRWYLSGFPNDHDEQAVDIKQIQPAWGEPFPSGDCGCTKSSM